MTSFRTCDLKEFLNHKTMYYDKIDFSIIEQSWKILESYITKPFVIHLVGTNGKGSTGRFLAHYLNKIGKKTLHYSSPHIKKFNERIWINGVDISDEQLEISHKKLQEILSIELLEKLTYFEYTTLLALYNSNAMDYLVLEAGLGGEFDATSVIINDLSLITTIDLDHMNFLGNTIKEIALTKMRACKKNMIIGHQIHDEVYAHANFLQKENNLNVFKINDFDINFDKSKLNFAAYLLQNLDLCLCTLRYLKIDIDMKIFESLILKGRCEKFSNNVTLDVGHNPLAAKALKDIFRNEKIILVYNSYADKDYKKVLEILKPIIKEVQIVSINDKRMVEKESLIKVCKNYNIMVGEFKKIEDENKYLVFGSFLVVERFLELYER